MKKLFIGLALLASMSSFANCNLYVNVNIEGYFERIVSSELSDKGFNIVEDPINATYTLDEVYTYWHGGDGVDGYGARITITNVKSGYPSYYVGDYTNYFFGLGMKKNPERVSIRRALNVIENCK